MESFPNWKRPVNQWKKNSEKKTLKVSNDLFPFKKDENSLHFSSFQKNQSPESAEFPEKDDCTLSKCPANDNSVLESCKKAEKKPSFERQRSISRQEGPSQVELSKVRIINDLSKLPGSLYLYKALRRLPSPSKNELELMRSSRNLSGVREENWKRQSATRHIWDDEFTGLNSLSFNQNFTAKKMTSSKKRVDSNFSVSLFGPEERTETQKRSLSRNRKDSFYEESNEKGAAAIRSLMGSWDSKENLNLVTNGESEEIRLMKSQISKTEKENSRLAKENQEMRDEINILKGFLKQGQVFDKKEEKGIQNQEKFDKNESLGLKLERKIFSLTPSRDKEKKESKKELRNRIEELLEENKKLDESLREANFSLKGKLELQEDYLAIRKNNEKLEIAVEKVKQSKMEEVSQALREKIFVENELHSVKKKCLCEQKTAEIQKLTSTINRQEKELEAIRLEKCQLTEKLKVLSKKRSMENELEALRQENSSLRSDIQSVVNENYRLLSLNRSLDEQKNSQETKNNEIISETKILGKTIENAPIDDEFEGLVLTENQNKKTNGSQVWGKNVIETQETTKKKNSVLVYEEWVVSDKFMQEDH